jgi:hypothetical protein
MSASAFPVPDFCHGRNVSATILDFELRRQPGDDSDHEGVIEHCCLSRLAAINA